MTLSTPLISSHDGKFHGNLLCLHCGYYLALRFELEFPTLESQPRMIYQTFFINQKFFIELSKNIIIVNVHNSSSKLIESFIK